MNLSKRFIFEINYSKKSQFFVQKPNFFQRQAIQKFYSFLNLLYTRDTPKRVWLDLNNCLIRWKRLFLKLLIRNNGKFLFKNLTFCRGKLYQKFLSFLGGIYPGDTPYQNWFNMNNPMTLSKKPNFKIT